MRIAVAIIGQALAQVRGLVTKHAIKQVGRLLSNNGTDVRDSFAHWVPHMIGARKLSATRIGEPARRDRLLKSNTPKTPPGTRTDLP